MPSYLANKRKRPSTALLLKQALREKQELALLEEKDRETVRLDFIYSTLNCVQAVLNSAWAKAERKVKGEKVMDDPTLLKKKLKREVKQKQASAAKWLLERCKIFFNEF